MIIVIYNRPEVVNQLWREVVKSTGFYTMVEVQKESLLWLDKYFGNPLNR
jgi:hypothetical protein